MNSILVPKLDINPTNTLFVTVSDVNDGVENLAKHYGIDLISNPDFSQIIARVEEFVSEWYSKDVDKEKNSKLESMVSELHSKNDDNGQLSKLERIVSELHSKKDDKRKTSEFESIVSKLYSKNGGKK